MSKQLYISTGAVKNSSGSAYGELGNMKIMCTVHGPRDTNLKTNQNNEGLLACDFRVAPFCQKEVYNPKGESTSAKPYSILLERILSSIVDLKSFPKSVVEIYIMVIEWDGDPLGLALMCASLALADAGISTYGLVGCSCICYTQDNRILVNPSSEAIRKAKCYTTLAILNSTKEIAYVSNSGAVSSDICSYCISRCKEEALRSCISMRESLLQHTY